MSFESNEGYRGPGARRRGKSGPQAMVLTRTPSNPIYPLRSSRREQVADHGPPGEPPHCLRSDDGVAGAERLWRQEFT
jgi:hypothetical protein